MYLCVFYILIILDFLNVAQTHNILYIKALSNKSSSSLTLVRETKIENQQLNCLEDFFKIFNVLSLSLCLNLA